MPLAALSGQATASLSGLPSFFPVVSRCPARRGTREEEGDTGGGGERNGAKGQAKEETRRKQMETKLW